jgi:hypothetical protein
MSLRDDDAKFAASLKRAAAGNMKMSVAPKGQVCSEKHKVILRNLSMEQKDTAERLERMLAKHVKKNDEATAEFSEGFKKSAQCEAEDCEQCTIRLCDCCCHDL